MLTPYVGISPFGTRVIARRCALGTSRTFLETIESFSGGEWKFGSLDESVDEPLAPPANPDQCYQPQIPTEFQLLAHFSRRDG